MPDPKDIVDSHLSKLSPARDVRPPTPEPTTEAGTTPNNALYDNPEPELTSGGRRRKSTERGDLYNADYARKEAIREKSNRTRARNTAMRARIAESERGRDTSDQQASHDAPRPQPLPESRPRGRSRTIRELSRSPTPGSTDHEQDEPAQPPINKDNYIHEKLTYKGLAERAKEMYDIDISGCNTQGILEKVRVAEGEQATKVGSLRRPASIMVRPGTPFKVGGGWHHKIPRSQPSCGKKRGLDALDNGPSKRARTTDCTTTESETELDDDSGNSPVRRAAERIANACPGMVVGADGSQSGTCPPPPSRAPTPEFVPATQYSQASTRSHSLGGSLSHYGESVPGKSTPPEPVPPIPMLIGTSRGPVHHRLRQKALKRYFDRANRDAERADKEAGVQDEDEVDQLDPTDDEPDTSYVPGSSTQNTSSASPPSSRPPHELLEDDEEMMAQAQAYAEGKLPSLPSSTPDASSSSTSHGGRKKKPLARDVSGMEREILSQAKVHLYVYALVQGIYQTRAAFLKWARAVYQATWEMELPMVPYVSVEDWIFEIMVNNLATLRGKAKEFTRPFAADSGGFEHTMTNQQTIQNNLNRFNLLYPNNFHCRSYYPRKGNFENPDVGRCIAVIVCSGPNAPARQYPDYVRDMCFNLVAFCMAIWQFCIGEWSHGWHQNGDLGMGAMRENYEGFLAQLKDLHATAPRRMGRLRNSWREFCEEYSGLSFDRQQAVVTGSAYRLEMRPDTPTPEQPALDDSISVDEMNEQLFETARQASLDSHAQEIIAREELEDLDAVINEEDWEELYALDRQEWEEQQAAARRSPSPLPQYDEDGRLTTQSKGKGHAN
ncbi:hypothetical protein FRC07_001886 [Ceratobasidium sp. 392]|nr:hypothetical protein FRC07_001886 [Ceratobasidium sp. 392]